MNIMYVWANFRKGMISREKILLLFAIALLATIKPAEAQISRQEVTGQLNAIQTGVPFLTIAPDSRAGAMGDAGVATSPDINSQHWNPAKFAFIEGSGGFAVSYSPWLRNLVPDINLAYLTGYYRIDKLQTISASMLYFSLGDIVFTDMFANVTRSFNPNEFSVDLAYSRAFSENISGGIAFRWIYSNLAGGVTVGGAETKPGTSFAADISTYYNKDIRISGLDGNAGFGVNISNIGTKISYTDEKDADFIPTNLKLGGLIELEIDEFNSVAFTMDINKLLVPTPPIWYEAAIPFIGSVTTTCLGYPSFRAGSPSSVKFLLFMLPPDSFFVRRRTSPRAS